MEHAGVSVLITDACPKGAHGWQTLQRGFLCKCMHRVRSQERAIFWGLPKSAQGCSESQTQHVKRSKVHMLTKPRKARWKSSFQGCCELHPLCGPLVIDALATASQVSDGSAGWSQHHLVPQDTTARKSVALSSGIIPEHHRECFSKQISKKNCSLRRQRWVSLGDPGRMQGSEVDRLA